MLRLDGREHAGGVHSISLPEESQPVEEHTPYMLDAAEKDVNKTKMKAIVPQMMEGIYKKVTDGYARGCGYNAGASSPDGLLARKTDAN